MDQHIIAIGGGGFGRSIGNLKIEKYISSLSSAKRPKICFIPTASGDQDSYKVSFYNAFTQIGCDTSHIDFFKRTIDLETHIENQDIIYVGGGNTKSMLAIWKDWGLDLILKKAYDRGLILSGVSAGAICWFTKAITDSWKSNLAIIDGLGFVEGACCPHFDEEENRIPFVKNSLKKKVLDNCIAIEGGCGLHLKNNIPYKSISFCKEKNSYFISLEKNKLKLTPYKVLQL